MFWISQSELEGNTVLALHGELDSCSEVQARDALAYTPSRIILDLEKLEFLDSRGLRVLIKARKQCDSRDGWMILSNPRGLVLKLLSALQMDREFLIWEDPLSL